MSHSNPRSFPQVHSRLLCYLQSTLNTINRNPDLKCKSP